MRHPRRGFSLSGCGDAVMSKNANERWQWNGGMGSAPPLLSYLLLVAAGWVHCHELILIESLQAENRLLKHRLQGRRIRFTNAEHVLLVDVGCLQRGGFEELSPVRFCFLAVSLRALAGNCFYMLGK